MNKFVSQWLVGLAGYFFKWGVTLKKKKKKTQSIQSGSIKI